MTTASKRTMSDTIRSVREFALPSDKSQAMTRATEAWLTASAECQREMIGFVSMRLDKNGETAREMMTCRNSADLASIHSRWIQETLRDYNTETTKLMTICTKSVNGVAGPRG